MIQDKLFTVDTATNESFLGYPTVGILPAIHPAWVPEFFGDTIVVNGKIWPYLHVEPRKYRFRHVERIERPLLLALVRAARTRGRS